MNKKLKGAILATAVAGFFFAAGTVNAAEEKKEEAKVKCSGINACGGKGACGGAEHDCAGKNSCKGKGWVKVGSEKECTDKGGKVVADKK
ncbi:MAG: hypothetical protein HYT76_06160 [Deltaproteobacteria bacterium]|nr:hypothetical protein [Deltaproteobacteria bacterium]